MTNEEKITFAMIATVVSAIGFAGMIRYGVRGYLAEPWPTVAFVVTAIAWFIMGQYLFWTGERADRIEDGGRVS